jgi:hypothetical protein
MLNKRCPFHPSRVNTRNLPFSIANTGRNDYAARDMALPNLRRLFVEARTEAEENEYSRNAVTHPPPETE